MNLKVEAQSACFERKIVKTLTPTIRMMRSTAAVAFINYSKPKKRNYNKVYRV